MSRGRTCCKVLTVSLVPVTVLILAILFFLGIILIPTLYSELAYKEQYGIVIDAGSSHTDVFLYTWKLPFYVSTGQISQLSYCDTQNHGLTSFTNNISQAGPSLYNCVHGVIKSQVPKKVYSSNNRLPLWLGGTAGLRLLNANNSTLSNEILKSARQTLSELDTTHHVKILSGAEEAVSGWITVNYIDGKLKKQYQAKRSLSKTMGALDMGGASMQISFVPPTSSNYNLTVELFGESYTTYSRSYLCYGVNEAWRRTLAYLVQKNFTDTNTSIDMPCLVKGDEIHSVKNMSYLFYDSNCTANLSPPSDTKPSDNITFNGIGDYQQCLSLVGVAMNFNTCVINDGSCVGGVYHPPNTTGDFMAFSTYSYTGNFFNNKHLDHTTLQYLENNITRYCNNGTTERYAYCFYGSYVMYVLTKGYGFNKSRDDWTITVKDKVNGIDVGWSLGYMLNQTNGLQTTPSHTHYPYTTVDLVIAMIVLTILCIIFIIFFSFTFSACRKALKPVATGYTNIS